MEDPVVYNAAADILSGATRPDKLAYVDAHCSLTYGALGHRVRQAAAALKVLGVEAEQRVALIMRDTVEFPVAFLGCIWAGVVPVPLNTYLASGDYRYMLRDSRARVAIISADIFPSVADALTDQPFLRQVLLDGPPASGCPSWQGLLNDTCDRPAETHAEEPCFWLYSSGSTGPPKGVVHAHQSLRYTYDTYGRQVWGISRDDIVFSASKLFFAYGLGNSLTFPLYAGATTILCPDRVTAPAVLRIFEAHRPTLFSGVPTVFAALLGAEELPDTLPGLRLCNSAGEALPEDVGRKWAARLGVDILDGIGSTELLHIFLSNRVGDVVYGTTGQAVPGYELALFDTEDRMVEHGTVGELRVRGGSSALGYWNRLHRSRTTFLGEWTRTGDLYRLNRQNRYVHQGRSDDMFKVGGLYVSPQEVEDACRACAQVQDVAVAGVADEHGMLKPKAYVVFHAGIAASDRIAQDLLEQVRGTLAHYKCPRSIEFVEELPRTATGKVQRFKLR